jgi:hypothetical protein
MIQKIHARVPIIGAVYPVPVLTSPPPRGTMARVEEWPAAMGSTTSAHEWPLNSFIVKPPPVTARVEELPTYMGAVLHPPGPYPTPVLTSPPTKPLMAQAEPPVFPGWSMIAQVFSPLPPITHPIPTVLARTEEYSPHMGSVVASHEWPLSSFIRPPQPIMARAEEPLPFGGAIVSWRVAPGVSVAATRSVMIGMEERSLGGVVLSGGILIGPPPPSPPPRGMFARLEEYPAHVGSVSTWHAWAPPIQTSPPPRGLIARLEEYPASMGSVLIANASISAPAAVFLWLDPYSTVTSTDEPTLSLDPFRTKKVPYPD